MDDLSKKPVDTAKPVESVAGIVPPLQPEVSDEKTVAATPAPEELANILPELSLLEPAPKKVAPPKIDALMQWLGGFIRLELILKSRKYMWTTC
ncbi:MAG: hypothetical protein R3E08_10225 [Thiotrichaceae bacterium]